MSAQLPAGWAKVLAAELAQPWWPKLQAFVAAEREQHVVHPPEQEVFAAFERTPHDRVRVLILGQDPYANFGQAHGLSFSVRPGVPLPGSLANLFRERQTDLGLPMPPHGYLGAWADRGVMLLNAVLTVRDGTPGSHANKGWEKLTDAVIDALDRRTDPVVFVLWGGYARKKASRIKSPWHRVLEGVHPSPLSANTGFFGSRPFSAVNRLLEEVGAAPVDWDLPDDPGPVPIPERPSDPAVRALADLDPPPVAPLEKVLQLDVWDRLSAEDRDRVGAVVERVLPAAFTYVGVREHQGRAVCHYDRQGEDWVLVPGGNVQLGWNGVKCKLGVPRRRAWAEACDEHDEPEAWLTSFGSPVRTVPLAPFLAPVEPSDGHALVARTRDDAAVDALQQVRAMLAAEGLDLPSPDEAEHLHAGGRRTVFPWGLVWPGDGGEAEDVGPFGARLGFDPERAEATSDPDVWRSGGLPAKGPVIEAWAAPSVRLDLRQREESGRWRELLATCRLRPIRRVFPYARRSG